MMINNYEILKEPIFQLPIMYSEKTCEKVIDERLSMYNGNGA